MPWRPGVDAPVRPLCSQQRKTVAPLRYIKDFALSGLHRPPGPADRIPLPASFPSNGDGTMTIGSDGFASAATLSRESAEVILVIAAILAGALAGLAVLKLRRSERPAAEPGSSPPNGAPHLRYAGPGRYSRSHDTETFLPLNAPPYGTKP